MTNKLNINKEKVKTMSISIEKKELFRWRRVIRDVSGYLLMVVLSIIIILPVLYLVFGSFKPKEEMMAYPPTLFPQRWTTGNYETLLLYPGLKKTEIFLLQQEGKIDKDILPTETGSLKLSGSSYARVYFNVLVIVLFSGLGVIVVGGTAGYAFAKINFAGRDFWFTLILSTMMVPWMIVLLPQYLIFRWFGMVGTLLPMFLPEFMFGLLNGGFMVFFFRQHFRTIPNEICESAKMDGASHIGIIFKLMFPMSKTILISAVFFTLVMKWNNMSKAIIYLTKPILYIPVQVAYNMTRSIGNEADPMATGLVMATAMLAITPFLLIFFIGQKYFVQGMASGSVRG